MRQFSDISNMKNALWFPQRGVMFIEKVLPPNSSAPSERNVYNVFLYTIPSHYQGYLVLT